MGKKPFFVEKTVDKRGINGYNRNVKTSSTVFRFSESLPLAVRQVKRNGSRNRFALENGIAKKVVGNGN